MGAFLGSLSNFSATDLGGLAIKGDSKIRLSWQPVHVPQSLQLPTAASSCWSIAAGALERAALDPQLVEEVFLGNVCSANLGQVNLQPSSPAPA